MRLTDYHSKTNAREIPVRCNPDQSDVVLHDVPIFKPLCRVVSSYACFSRSEHLVDTFKVEIVIYVDKRLIIMEYNVTYDIF